MWLRLPRYEKEGDVSWLFFCSAKRVYSSVFSLRERERMSNEGRFDLP